MSGGTLSIILGPMFSGKTKELYGLYNLYKCNNKPVLAINHQLDKRYGSNENENLVFTHDGCSFPCIPLKRLFDIDMNKVDEAKVILINEGQFFEDLVPFVEMLLQKNKDIYVCGLDGDFQRKKFGTILDLIPFCDRVTKLTSKCSLCSKNGREIPRPGLFSKRKTNETDVVVVGSDNYDNVCRECYDL